MTLLSQVYNEHIYLLSVLCAAILSRAMYDGTGVSISYWCFYIILSLVSLYYTPPSLDLYYSLSLHNIPPSLDYCSLLKLKLNQYVPP